MKVVAFNGSPRKDGNTAILIRHVFAGLEKEGIETEMVQLAGHRLRGCLACFQCFANADRRCVQKGDALNTYIEKMVAAEGIVLGSPVYVASVPAEMKALIDRALMVTMANGGLLRRKVGAAVVAARRGGQLPALDTLNHFFLVSEMIVPGSSHWSHAFGLEKGDVDQDTEGIQTIETLGQNMAWLLKKLY
jgi:multimeric flavodoxin WrbA